MAGMKPVQELSDPAQHAESITPADTDLASPVRALYIGVTGDVAVILAADTVAVTFKNVPVGFFPCSCKQVKTTGTTASQIIGLR